jgi:hypothetical protein
LNQHKIAKEGGKVEGDGEMNKIKWRKMEKRRRNEQQQRMEGREEERN